MQYNLKDILLKLKNLPSYESEGKKHVYNTDLLKLAKKIRRNQSFAKHLSIRIAELLKMSKDDLETWLDSGSGIGL